MGGEGAERGLREALQRAQRGTRADWEGLGPNWEHWEGNGAAVRIRGELWSRTGSAGMELGALGGSEAYVRPYWELNWGHWDGLGRDRGRTGREMGP